MINLPYKTHKLNIFKSALLALILLTVTFCSNQREKSINVEINKNVETIAIVFDLTDNIPLANNFVEPFRVKSKRQFSQFKESEAVKIARELISCGFWLDCMMYLALYTSEFPEAKIIHKFDESCLIRASSDNDKEEGQRMVNQFITALNDFYREAKVKEYIKENWSIYEGVMDEVKKNLPDKNFVKLMENYYGQENVSYTLIPSPNLRATMGFGPRIKTKKGLKIFNIIAPVVVTQDSMDYEFGFDNASEISEASAHEFGHSFVNPLVELPQHNEIVKRFSYLFKPIKNKMSEQGYPDWFTCVKEHIVRLGEIRISYLLNDSTRANRLRDEYVHNRKFVYIPALEENIKRYEQNRDKYKSLKDYFPKLLEALATIDTTQTFQSNAIINPFLLELCT